MEEQLITFKTAKLAQKKGFKLDKYLSIDDENPKNLNSNYNPRKYQPWFYDLTQSLLQKWLREVHYIHIKLECFIDNTWDGILIYEDAPYEWDDNTAPVEAENCKTYEEALEICLQEALKLI